MMEAMLLCARLLAAGSILALGGAKFAQYPRSANVMWRPRWMSYGVFRTLFIAVCTFECAFAVLFAVGLLPPFVSLPLTVVGAVFLTTYGLQAISRTGTCGCGNRKQAKKSPRRLLVLRNASVFGTITTCILCELCGLKSKGTMVELIGASCAPSIYLLGRAAIFALTRLSQQWVGRVNQSIG